MTGLDKYRISHVTQVKFCPLQFEFFCAAVSCLSEEIKPELWKARTGGRSSR
jgi:hypothetical protein